MKRIKNIIIGLVALAAILAAALTTRWWACWFIYFPIAVASVIYLIDRNSDWIARV